MKNVERKKKGQTQGRTNRRMPICNPTIQLIVVNLYTKYEVSILSGCGDIFDKKVLRNYGRTDGRTDRTMDRCKPVYPPLGIITSSSIKKTPLAHVQYVHNKYARFKKELITQTLYHKARQMDRQTDGWTY